MTRITNSHHRAVLLAAIALLLSLCCPPAFAARPVVWQTNYNTALVHAKRQNKPVLAYFSGSDWDQWGKKLEKEVLKSDLFAEWVHKSVIPFQADYPSNKPHDLFKKQNEDLKTKYQISVVPTFLLLDSDGEVVARATYDDIKLRPDEPVGQPKIAVAFLTNMVANRGEAEPLNTFPSLLATLDNAKEHKLPVMLLVTRGEKDPMLAEAEKLANNQRFVRWANVNTSFYRMKFPEPGDKSEDAAMFNGLVERFKIGNAPAQLLMFKPDDQTLRTRVSKWNTMQMEPLMARLQKELPVIEYKGTDWLTDIRIARAIVSQQPKRILFLYFTDNTEFCQKIEKEILESEEFTGFSFDHLVSVRLDYTTGIEQPQYIADQNKALADLYGVRGYPFCVMVNPKGQKIGEAKYMKGGPKTFVSELKKAYFADYDRRTLTGSEPGR
jgi:thioredoxin-related protein